MTSFFDRDNLRPSGPFSTTSGGLPHLPCVKILRPQRPMSLTTLRLPLAPLSGYDYVGVTPPPSGFLRRSDVDLHDTWVSRNCDT